MIFVRIVPVVFFTCLVLGTVFVLSVLCAWLLEIACDCDLTGMVQDSLSGVGFSFRFSFNIVCIKLVEGEFLIGVRCVLVAIGVMRGLV